MLAMMLNVGMGFRAVERRFPCDSGHSLNVLALPDNRDEQVRTLLCSRGWVVL